MQKNKSHVIFLILFGFHLDTFVMFRFTSRRMYKITIPMVQKLHECLDAHYLLTDPKCREYALEELGGSEYNGHACERKHLYEVITDRYYNEYVRIYHKKVNSFEGVDYLPALYSLISGERIREGIEKCLKEALQPDVKQIGLR